MVGDGGDGAAVAQTSLHAGSDSFTRDDATAVSDDNGSAGIEERRRRLLPVSELCSHATRVRHDRGSSERAWQRSRGRPAV